jgi:hypothetical protein|tara:strand:- start:1020 stop:1211 length:192 start_codon:yes stop_codon:yes gene_type:complete
MKSDKVLMTGIIILGFLQITAMFFGINGTFRTYVIGAILLILGVQMPKEKIMEMIEKWMQKIK